MTLDLIVRGAGSSRSPGDHIAAVLAEYASATVILYGQVDNTAALPVPARSVVDPDGLSVAIKAVGNGTALVYGDESLLTMAPDLQPDLIWITLGPDANGVREIWRVRQQHSWLSQRKLGLLIEQLPDGAAPDTDRLMRLSRATRAVLVSVPATTEVAPARQPAPAPSRQPSPEPVPVPEVETAVPSAPEVEPAVSALAETPEATPETVAIAAVPEPAAAPAADPEPMAEAEPETVAEPMAEAEPEVTAPASVPVAPTPTSEGADVDMETNTTDRHEAGAPVNAQAEQALMQRYALVKERRATSTRVAQVEATVQSLLKEIFVSRFAAGPEAAATLESLARKLTDASAEYTQLSRAMANIEAQLAKLAWLKDELEI